MQCLFFRQLHKFDSLDFRQTSSCCPQKQTENIFCIPKSGQSIIRYSVDALLISVPVVSGDSELDGIINGRQLRLYVASIDNSPRSQQIIKRNGSLVVFCQQKILKIGRKIPHFQIGKSPLSERNMQRVFVFFLIQQERKQHSLLSAQQGNTCSLVSKAA